MDPFRTQPHTSQNPGPHGGGKYPKRLWVPRIGTRRLLNEHQITPIFKHYGFETVIPDNLSVAEQIRYFYNADHVVIPHGAGSSNLLFMRPGTKFLELFPFTWGPRHVVKLAHVLDIDFRELTENPNMDALDRERAFDSSYFNSRDYIIRPDRVEYMIRRMIHG